MPWMSTWVLSGSMTANLRDELPQLMTRMLWDKFTVTGLIKQITCPGVRCLSIRQRSNDFDTWD